VNYDKSGSIRSKLVASLLQELRFKNHRRNWRFGRFTMGACWRITSGLGHLLFNCLPRDEVNRKGKAAVLSGHSLFRTYWQFDS